MRQGRTTKTCVEPVEPVFVTAPFGHTGKINGKVVVEDPKLLVLGFVQSSVEHDVSCLEGILFPRGLTYENGVKLLSKHAQGASHILRPESGMSKMQQRVRPPRQQRDTFRDAAMRTGQRTGRRSSISHDTPCIDSSTK